MYETRKWFFRVQMAWVLTVIVNVIQDKYSVRYSTYERVHIQSATYTNLFPSFSSCGSVLFYSLLTMVPCHSAHDVVLLGATGSCSILVLTQRGYGSHSIRDILLHMRRVLPCTWATSLTDYIHLGCTYDVITLRARTQYINMPFKANTNLVRDLIT